MKSNPVFISTRPRLQSGNLKNLCEQYGEFLEFPLIEVTAIENTNFDFNTIETYSWLVFTSVNGVNYFFNELKKPLSESIKIAAIGKTTANALSELSVNVDFENNSTDATSFANDLKKHWKGNNYNVLWPTSQIAKHTLTEALANYCEITRLNIYKTILPKQFNKVVKERIIKSDYDLIFFYNSSAVQNFKQIFANKIDYSRVKAACIGRVTAKTCYANGIEPLVTATAPNTEVLFNESKLYLENKQH